MTWVVGRDRELPIALRSVRARRWGRGNRTQRHAQPQRAVPSRWWAAMAGIGAAVLHVGPPATTSKHSVHAGRRSGWIGQRAAGVLAVPIEAPLGRVAARVVQAPGVRLLLADRVRAHAPDARLRVDRAAVGGEPADLVRLAV